MKIQKATSSEDFERCFEVMKELRPHHSPDSFLTAMEQMKNEGYELWYIKDKGQAVCVAGFRFTTTLYDGLIIDFDDFVTISGERNKALTTSVSLVPQSLRVSHAPPPPNNGGVMLTIGAMLLPEQELK